MTGQPGRIEFCYITTTGRVSGTPHRIEIWFAREKETLYLLAGGGERADWVRNVKREPSVVVDVGDQRHHATARIVADPEEDALARRLVVAKYQPGYGEDLSSWGRTALPVAIDLA